MSSADLDYIRALLVAQTDEPEPQVHSLLGRLFAKRAEPPRPPPPSPPPPPRFSVGRDRTAPVSSDAESEPELLLEHFCRPPRPVETASPPPATPRGEFGRRPDIAPDLVLDQPATTSRRLQLFDPSGQPVGEMILHPDEPPMRVSAPLGSEEAPYFPEDLLEPGRSAQPQPLRPWLKALRTPGPAQPAMPKGAERVESDPGDGATLVKQAPHRRAQRRRPGPRPSQSLGHDLLDALALTLVREQETLDDRLLSVAGDGVPEQALADPAAA